MRIKGAYVIYECMLFPNTGIQRKKLNSAITEAVRKLAK